VRRDRGAAPQLLQVPPPGGTVTRAGPVAGQLTGMPLSCTRAVGLRYRFPHSGPFFPRFPTLVNRRMALNPGLPIVAPGAALIVSPRAAGVASFKAFPCIEVLRAIDAQTQQKSGDPRVGGPAYVQLGQDLGGSGSEPAEDMPAAAICRYLSPFPRNDRAGVRGLIHAGCPAEKRLTDTNSGLYEAWQRFADSAVTQAAREPGRSRDLPSSGRDAVVDYSYIFSRISSGP
jgi:hypothetical protein